MLLLIVIILVIIIVSTVFVGLVETALFFGVLGIFSLALFVLMYVSVQTILSNILKKIFIAGYDLKNWSLKWE